MVLTEAAEGERGVIVHQAGGRRVPPDASAAQLRADPTALDADIHVREADAQLVGLAPFRVPDLFLRSAAPGTPERARALVVQAASELVSVGGLPPEPKLRSCSIESIHDECIGLSD